MGYSCPVCGTPQADERHLADHLAVTAMTHGDDHEAWLDEHVPDWTEHRPKELGPVVAEEAVEAEYPQVFEDTVDRGGHDHRHDPDRGETLEDHLASGGRRGPRAAGRGDLAADAEGVLAEAREMTRQMMGEEGDDDAGTDHEGIDGDDRGGEGTGGGEDEGIDGDDRSGGDGSGATRGEDGPDDG